jgi:hypothetical protein
VEKMISILQRRLRVSKRGWPTQRHTAGNPSLSKYWSYSISNIQRIYTPILGCLGAGERKAPQCKGKRNQRNQEVAGGWAKHCLAQCHYLWEGVKEVVHLSHPHLAATAAEKQGRNL